MAYFTEPQQIMDYLYDLFQTNQQNLGVAHIAYGEETLIPAYPAVIVTAGPVAREIHGTHTFDLRFMLELWVYHANLESSHQVRTREDLDLVSNLRSLLHEHLRLFGSDGKPQVIFSWVSAEDPAFIRRPGSRTVVGTRLEWQAMSQERFGSS
jgi:hypothetical protein